MCLNAGSVSVQSILSKDFLGSSVIAPDFVHDRCKQQPYGRPIGFHVQRPSECEI